MSSTEMSNTDFDSTGTTGTGMSGTGANSSDSATDEAKAQASNLAGATREEAASVAEEARTQARNVMDDARTMVDEQTRTQRDRVVETARSFGGDLDQMAQAGPDGMAGDVTRQVAERIRSLSEHLDGREPTDILEDVRDFARRRPGLFLLGALGAGVVFGRMARGAKDAQSDSAHATTDTTRTSTYADTSTAAPPAYDAGMNSASAPRAGVPATGPGPLPYGDTQTAADGPSDAPLGDEARRSL